MCYDIKANLEAQLSRANRKGVLQAIKEIKEKVSSFKPPTPEPFKEFQNSIKQQRTVNNLLKNPDDLVYFVRCNKENFNRLCNESHIPHKSKALYSHSQCR